MNVGAELGREALESFADTMRDVRFDFVKSAPDLACYMHALRTELKPSELRDRGKHPLARDGAAAAVLQCPALLGYSLDGRLRPRLRRIRQAGLPLADIATLAQCPEAQFEKRLQGRLARA